MRWIKAGLLAVVVASLVAVLLSTRTGSIDSQLTCDNLSLGKVWSQPSLDWTIAVVNASSEPITVTDLHASCSCTKIDPVRFVVAAHSQQDVLLTLDLRPRERSWEQVSPFRVHILPVIAGSSGPHPGWLLAGEVQHLFNYDPDRTYFGALNANGLSEQSLEIESYLPLSRFVATCDPAFASPSVISNGEGRYRVTLKAGNSRQLGLKESPVVLSAALSDGTVVPEYALNCSYDLVGRVYAVPECISFGAVTPAQPEVETLVVRSRDGRAFEITDLTSEVTALNERSRNTIEVAIEERSDSERHVRITLFPEHTGDWRETLTVHVAGNGEYDFPILLLAHVRESDAQ